MIVALLGSQTLHVHGSLPAKSVAANIVQLLGTSYERIRTGG